MKLFLSLGYCLLGLPVFSQNKLSVNDLKRYEWIVYNRNVADSSEIFKSDTLLLVKSVELESLEQLTGENDQQIDQLYPRCWRLNLSSEEVDTSTGINEFYFFFIDLRKAASRRSMEVDSISYDLLMRDPNSLSSETSPVLIELEKMQSGDIIQIVNPLNNQYYYIEKNGNKLQVIRTLKRRYIFNPTGIHDGFWTFSKRNQLITFSTSTGEIHFVFRIERIDNLRIRLIRTTLHATKQNM